MEQVTSMKKPLFLRATDREQSKRRTQYRYKTTEHVQNRKHKRDEDGFFVPLAMFRPYNGSGLLCEVLGTTSARRMADLRVQQDYLMKEAYEHEIEMLMCQMRLHELAFHRHFCTEDRAEERYVRRVRLVFTYGSIIKPSIQMRCTSVSINSGSLTTFRFARNGRWWTFT